MLLYLILFSFLLLHHLHLSLHFPHHLLCSMKKHKVFSLLPSLLFSSKVQQRQVSSKCVKLAMFSMAPQPCMQERRRIA